MIANEGSDPQSGAGRPESAGKVPPLNKDTDMVIFELFLSGFCSTFQNGPKCLTTDWSKVEEDVAAKAKLSRKSSKITISVSLFSGGTLPADSGLPAPD